jgi:hypothetical protein
MEANNDTERTKMPRIQTFSANDPRKAQLLALFDLSDKRGQDLLIAIAVIHADRYPKVPK